MNKMIASILVSAMLLSGCGAMEDAIENKVDALEETLEQKVNDAANALLDPNAAGEKHTPVDPASLLSPEDAQRIALEHAELMAEDVVGLHTVLQIDDGRQEYEVTFRSGHLEYEYEIDAASGTILSVEIDD